MGGGVMTSMFPDKSSAMASMGVGTFAIVRIDGVYIDAEANP